MNLNKIILGSLLGVALLVAAISGYRYIERSQAEERLLGTWQQEDPFATFQKDGADAAPEDAISSVDDDSEAQDADGLHPVTIPGLEEGLRKAISLRTTLTFEEDGRVIIATGDTEFQGRWVLSQANGKNKTIVARVMQTPTFEQRLVMPFHFEGKDRIIIADEAGIEGAFDRVDP